MNARLLIATLTFLLIFIALHIYVGVHILLYIEVVFSKTLSPLMTLSFWFILFFSSVSFFVSRAFKKIMYRPFYSFLHIVGAYWLGILFYLTLLLLVGDGIALLLTTMFTTTGTATIISWIGMAIILSLLLLLVIGYYNGTKTVIRQFHITIKKRVNGYQNLHILLASDLHLSTIITNKRLQSLVDIVNEQRPDFLFLAGDIIDEDIEPFVEEEMTKTLKTIHPSIQTFAVTGNHDYYGGHVQELVSHLHEANITVLLDDCMLIHNTFYVVGRKDFASGERKNLQEILMHIDDTRPIFLLDHQPRHLHEAVEAGVDLQVSGHTHRGQIIPNHLITKRLFEVDWGYLQKQWTHFIVSSGFGTWGPPIRIGSRSEVVSIHVSFQAE